MLNVRLFSVVKFNNLSIYHGFISLGLNYS